MFLGQTKTRVYVELLCQDSCSILLYSSSHSTSGSNEMPS